MRAILKARCRFLNIVSKKASRYVTIFIVETSDNGGYVIRLSCVQSGLNKLSTSLFGAQTTVTESQFLDRSSASSAHRSREKSCHLALIQRIPTVAQPHRHFHRSRSRYNWQMVNEMPAHVLFDPRQLTAVSPCGLLLVVLTIGRCSSSIDCHQRGG